MHNARLEDRLGEGHLDRFGQSRKAIGAEEQDVLHASVPQLGQDREPELRALGVLKPHPEHVTSSLVIDADDQVQALVPYAAAVAHLHDECVQVDDGVADLQWPISPLAHFTEHCVRDPADEIVADVDAVDLREMAADFSVAEAACVHRENLLLEAWNRPLVGPDELRLEAALAVPRDLDLNLAEVRPELLLSMAVAAVGLVLRRLLAILVVEMGGELCLERTVDHRAQTPAPAMQESSVS